MIRRFLISVAAAFGIGVAPAAAFELSAREAILVDEASRTVLYEKNSDDRTYPSSMTKLMTVYLLFEKLADGSLALDDTLPVSEKAWRKGGSKMFVEVGSRVEVEDLIRGIVVQSGNDASIVVAEGLAGSEAAFADLMTRKARELEMVNTTFVNSSGWPEDDHVTTVEDLSIIARRTIEDFPQYYHYYSETEFTFNDIRQGTGTPCSTPGLARMASRQVTPRRRATVWWHLLFRGTAG